MSLASTVLTALPQKQEGKPYLSILREPISLDEKLMAIYVKAIKDIHIFKPHQLPSAPQGYVESHQAYMMADNDEKPSLWKGIITHDDFKGYLFKLDQVKAENASNKHFLNEMRTFFEWYEDFTGQSADFYIEKLSIALNDYCEV